jgi:hypothetical protein
VLFNNKARLPTMACIFTEVIDMRTRTFPSVQRQCGLAPLALLTLLAAGCAATINQEGLEQRTSLAIGRSVGEFTISDRSEETGGRINYSVKDKSGATYKCYLYSATGFQKAMSFGQTPNSDAICTPMGKGGAAPAAASCNALLKAAGKC